MKVKCFNCLGRSMVVVSFGVLFFNAHPNESDPHVTDAHPHKYIEILMHLCAYEEGESI